MRTVRLAALVAGLAWLVASAAPAFAQGAVSLTLEDAVTRAVAHAPRLAEARAQEAAAAAITAGKRAQVLPQLSVSAEYQRTNHVTEFGLLLPDGTFKAVFPDIPNTYWLRSDLNIPIWPVDAAKDAIASSRADERVLAADRKTSEQDIRLDTARAYWTLVLARENVRVLIEGQQRMDAWVADVKSRVDAGVLGLNEVLTAQAQSARQNVQLIQARNNAALAEVDLARLVGVDPGTPITTTSRATDALTNASAAASQTPQALITRALESRSEREGLREKKNSVNLLGRAALGATAPQVNGIASVMPARPNPRFAPRADEWKTSWDAGIRVVWPIFDGGRAKANHAAATAQATVIDHRIEQFDALVSLEIRQRLLEIDSGKAALAASAEVVAAFAEARRVAQARFEAGVVTSTDVLDAQLALTEAEIEQVRLAVALRLSEARLLRAVGGL